MDALDDSTATVAPMISPSEALAVIEPPTIGKVDEIFLERVQSRYGYRVGSFNFVIPKGTSSEIFHSQRLTPIPKSPKWLVGLCITHGDLVPVFDFALLLGLNDEDSSVQSGHKGRDMFLTIGRGEKCVGLLIDDLPITLELSNASPINRLPPVPDSILSHVHGCFNLHDEIWFELNYLSFIDDVVDQHLLKEIKD